MSDVFSKAKRSEVMARIRSRGNRDTELRLIALMREHGITGWRRQRTLRMSESGCRKGKAFAVNVDFVFPKQRVAVFVDGCFWHGCPRHATMPATRAAWWAAKLARNRTRDRLVTRTLRKAGWRVVRIWECALTRKNRQRAAAQLRRALEQ